MYRVICLILFAALITGIAGPSDLTARTPDGKLRIIIFGAHPDDNEYRNGGTAILWANLGHEVKFVSTTNGDIGHYAEAGGPLALRRTAEVKAAARVLGIAESQVLDIHDGEIMPTLENRKIIARLIRDWQADIVISHRPWDYHPDHRYTAVLVQDAAYMSLVPFFVPDTPPTPGNPVFLYNSDRFQKPYPFTADIAVAIDDVFQQKLDAIMEIPSQSVERGANGSQAKTDMLPDDPAARRAMVEKAFAGRAGGEAERFRDVLIKWYGAQKGRAVKYAETFEICEYGKQPTDAEIRELFPFYE